MDRTFKRVGLFVLCCLIVSLVKAQTDLRPRNVSVSFVNAFCLKASWEQPEGFSPGCQYEYYWIPKETKYSEQYVSEPRATLYPTIKGGTMKLSVQTVQCDGVGQRVVVDVTTNPELFRDFQCALHSPTGANCSWTPSSHVSNLRLFYWIDPTCGPLSLKECVSFPHPDNEKRVCHISEDGLKNHLVYFLFNGTQDNMSVRNTFKKWMKHNVRPPALKLDLIRDGDYLRINWTSPDVFPDSWKYLINYTECDKGENISIKAGKTSFSIPYTPHCQYRIRLKALNSNGETPWSDEEVYGDNWSRHALLITVAAVSPLLVALILFLAFCAVRKYKEQIFPKVPEPKNLLKDMLDNNNKCPSEKLYVPEEEAEDTKVCLVLEPQVTSLDAEIP